MINEWNYTIQSQKYAKSKRKEREINILEIFDHESTKIALTKGFYSNGVLKESQLRSKEK